MKRKLTPREIAAIRRRRWQFMLADNGGERPTPPEPSWNMRVVAHPEDGYEMPQTTGAFTLVKKDGDTYFYQHDGSSSTGNNVLGVYNNVSTHLGVSDVTFKDCEHITSIGNAFLYNCISITQINLSPLSNVTSIGGEFLYNCSITQIDLSPLSNVTSIGNAFLYQCKGLTQIDISPLSNVTSIANFFLFGCRNLTQIDLSPLSNVTSIGSSFLSACRALTLLKTPWTTIPTTATTAFMGNVPAKCTIEVPCESVDVYKSTQPWSNRADYINGGEGCEEPEPSWNMKVVAHPDEGYEMPTTTGNFTLTEQYGDTYYYSLNEGVTSTGDNVLYDESIHWCVDDVTFKDCEHITSIGDYFLHNSTKLTSVDLSQLSNTTSIGSRFLRGCSSLTSIDITLPNVTSIAGSFLRDCTNLTSLNLSLPNITRLDGSFVRGCNKLTTLNLSQLSNVTSIEGEFLYGCSSLKSLDLTSLPNTNSIGSNFLYNCKTLTSLKLPWATIPTTSTTSFMSSVPTSCSIEVPCEALSTYKTSTPWKNRASHIVADCPPSEYNMKVVAHPDDGSMPQTTGNFTLIKNIGDTYYYSLNDGAASTGDNVLNSSRLHITDVEFVNCDNITEIGFNFLCNNDITAFDVTPFKNVTHIKSEFLVSTKIESIDFTPIVNNIFVENNFMAYSGSLVYAKMPWSTPFAPFIGLFYGTPSNFEIHVPCGSGNDYKQSWTDHTDVIVEDC